MMITIFYFNEGNQILGKHDLLRVYKFDKSNYEFLWDFDEFKEGQIICMNHF